MSQVGGLSRLVAAVLYLSAPFAFAAHRAPIVHAPAGAVRGVKENGMIVFKGIPYALPPVGPARWKPPLASPKWRGIRTAYKFGPACMQKKAPPSPANVYWQDIPSMSEDCLTLNVWAPAHAKAAPVFVWIHGGAFAGGASSDGSLCLGKRFRSYAGFVPGLGFVAGATSGAIAGHFAKYGITKQYMEQINKAINPGQSALFVLADNVKLDRVIPMLSSLHPKVLRTSLTLEQEKAMRDAFGTQ